QRVKGVLSTTAGYSGGSAKTATYKQVITETTGHAESVEVIYDATRRVLTRTFRSRKYSGVDGAKGRFKRERVPDTGGVSGAVPSNGGGTAGAGWLVVGKLFGNLGGTLTGDAVRVPEFQGGRRRIKADQQDTFHPLSPYE